MLTAVSWLLLAVGGAAALLALLLLALLLAPRRPNHWRRLGVPHRADRFPLGARGAAAILGSYPAALLREYAETKAAGGVRAHLDADGGPAATVADLRLVARVMAADFEHFTDRQPPARRRGFTARMMMNRGGDDWRRLRAAIAPAFSAARLRRAAPICLQRARRLAGQLRREAAAAADGAVEVEAVFQRYTLDTVAAVAFGLEARAIERPQCEMARRARALVARPSPWVTLLRAAAGRLGLGRLLPAAGDEPFPFFDRVSREAMARRRASGERRDDALQLLIDHRDDEGRPLADDEVAAQCVMLFLGGYGNTAAALAWCARCLAWRPEVQARLRAGLDRRLAGRGGDDAWVLAADLDYLDQVVREALRLYPAATPQLARCVTAPYRLAGAGQPLPLSLHATVYVPVLGIQRDPDLYPDPDRFDPDRFAAGRRRARPAAAWLPFGLGPRACPARQLALLELKLALLALLAELELAPCARSGAEQPQFMAGPGMLREKGGTWLMVRRREQPCSDSWSNSEPGY